MRHYMLRLATRNTVFHTMTWALRGRALCAGQATAFNGRLTQRVAAMTTRSVDEARNKHARTLHEVFAHPLSTKLRWHAVMSMVEAFGATHYPSGDGAKEHITLGGRTMFLTKPKHSSNSITNAADVMALRHFLSAAGLAPDAAHAAAEVARQRALETPHAAAATAPPASLDGRHVVVWLSFTEAKLFRCHLPRSSPDAVLHPWDPNGKRQHLHIKHGRVQNQATPTYHGDWVPPDPRFLKAIITALGEDDTDAILIACHGTGKSNAADALEAAMRHHAPGLGAKVVGRLTLSEGHTTTNELLAAARAFYNQHQQEGGLA